MSSSPPSVFICGVTGNQGEAVAIELLKLGWTVKATARSLEAPKVKALAAEGLKPVQGDWDNEEALRDGLAGCTKLFLNTVTTVDDLERERQQAARIINMAKAAGVKQVISSTSLGVSCVFSYFFSYRQKRVGEVLEADKGDHRIYFQCSRPTDTSRTP